MLNPGRHSARIHLLCSGQPGTVRRCISGNADYVLFSASAIPKDAIQIPILLRLVLVVHHVWLPSIPKHSSHDRIAARGEYNFPTLSRFNRVPFL